MLRFRSRGLRFRVFGCFVFDLGVFVFKIWVLRASVFVFECFSSRKPTSSTLSAIQGSISSSFRNHEEHLSKLAKSELT